MSRNLYKHSFRRVTPISILIAMSKKTFMAAIIILAFLISLATGMQAVDVAKANPIPWCFDPQMTVTIQSPVGGANCALPLLVSFTAQGDSQFSVSDNVTLDWLRSFFYVLDGQDMRSSGWRFEGTKTTQIYGDPVYYYSFSGQANLTDLTDGLHSITVYYGAVNSVALIGSPNESIVCNQNWAATSQFYVNSTLTPSSSPISTPSPTSTAETAMSASLSESASSLNFGNTINFTVSVEGGKAPFTYTWNIEKSSDSTIVQATTSPYYSSDTFSIGSHHVHVEVKDADNNSVSTLTVEFNVLPASSNSPSLSPSLSSSSTQQPTLKPSPTPNNIQENFASTLTLIGLGTTVVVVLLLVYVAKFRGKKQ